MFLLLIATLDLHALSGNSAAYSYDSKEACELKLLESVKSHADVLTYKVKSTTNDTFVMTNDIGFARSFKCIEVE